MKAYHWLGKDGYQYFICCTKENAVEIISRFGMEAKAPTVRLDDNIKYSFYILNIHDKIITPIRWLSGLSSAHVQGAHGDSNYPLIGEECSVAVFLDSYRLMEYPFGR